MPRSLVKRRLWATVALMLAALLSEDIHAQERPLQAPQATTVRAQTLQNPMNAEGTYLRLAQPSLSVSPETKPGEMRPAIDDQKKVGIAAGFGMPSPVQSITVDQPKEGDNSLDSAFLAFLKKNPTAIAGGITAYYDNGLVFKPSKGAYDLKVNFLGHVWYDHINNDPSYPPLNAAASYPSDADSFILRRAQLSLSGHVTEHVRWRFSFDPARGIGGRSPPLVVGAPTEAFLENKRILDDLFIDYEFLRPEHCFGPLDSMTLRVGQFIIPQTDDGGYFSSHAMDFPERSIIGYLFGQQRSAGAMLHGTFFEKRLVYQASMYNGNGRNVFRDENDPFDFAFRLEAKPFAKMLDEHARFVKQVKAENPMAVIPAPLIRDMHIGVSGSTGVDGRADKTFRQDAFGVEFSADILDYFVRADWYRGRPIGSNLTVTPSNSAPNVSGWYVTAGMYFWKQWQIAVRYQQFDPNISAGNDLVEQTTLGLSYFFDPNFDRHVNHGAKISLAYNFNRVHSVSPASPTGFIGNGDELILMFQVAY
jgi:hypothetical protein